MSQLDLKLRTALRLGLVNLVRALSYRLGVKTGLHPVRRLKAASATGPFFLEPSMQAIADVPPVLAFGWAPVGPSNGPPDWFADPLGDGRVDPAGRPWWTIPDFDPAGGDIKLVWELSRMDWAPRFAALARAGDTGQRNRLEAWLTDWAAHNPGYIGPNWKCGQEASLRVINLATAAIVLEVDAQPRAGLLDLVELHLRRIAPTIQYAVAQDNNHGTSEAAALFIGGVWLSNAGRTVGGEWEAMGRRWLEERIARLVAPDGGFSQYSVNYHRLMLDTISVAELWRVRHGRPPLSDLFQSRMAAAIRWLHAIVDPETGDAPNLGANDGARILQISETDYRDYRPSVQIAAALFLHAQAYLDPVAMEAATLLGLGGCSGRLSPPASRVSNDTGLAVLRRESSMAVLRFPRFRFRPSQADALHLDFWRSGRNLLRDGGSYSYADAEANAYFGGVQGHNTVQFDGRDQMVRLSRFLYADWLSTAVVEPLVEGGDETTFGAGYRDRAGAEHRRTVRLSDSQLTVEDTLSGFSGEATLRWRLEPGSWALAGATAKGRDFQLSITSDVPLSRCAIVEGREARYYLDSAPTPVFEVGVAKAARLTTVVRWEDLSARILRR